VGPTQRRGRLNPPYEPVNLSIFATTHLSQIKGLAGAKIAKTGNIHILYEPAKRHSAGTKAPGDGSPGDT
jgi:hypothetical protein